VPQLRRHPGGGRLIRTQVACLIAAQIAFLGSCNAAYAQVKAGDADTDAVTITALRNPVDKSYRRMVAGMELFEKSRPSSI